MTLTVIFAILSGFFAVASGPSYFTDILKGKTKPERVTWIIWGALSIMAFGSQLALGATWSLLFAGLDMLGTLAVLALALKFGVGGWTKLDRLGLVIAGLGLAIAIVARAPLIALFGALLADLSGALLTIRKTFLTPTSESTIAWLLFGASALFAALSVGKWRFDLLLYPVYIALCSWGIVAAKYAGSLAARKKHTAPASRTV